MFNSNDNRTFLTGKLILCGLFSYLLLIIIRLLFSVYEKFLPDIPHPTPLTSIVFVVLAFFVGLFLVHWLPSKLNRLLSKNFALTRISAVIMGTSVPLIVGVYLDVEKFALGLRNLFSVNSGQKYPSFFNNLITW